MSIRVYELIKDLFFLVDDGDRQLLEQFNLTVPRFYILAHLDESPGLSPHELSKRMLCDKSNITRLIRGMEADGFIAKRKHETDGRSVRLYLTDVGGQVCARAKRAHQEFNHKRFHQIADPLEQIDLATLERIKETLTSELFK